MKALLSDRSLSLILSILCGGYQGLSFSLPSLFFLYNMKGSGETKNEPQSFCQ